MIIPFPEILQISRWACLGIGVLLGLSTAAVLAGICYCCPKVAAAGDIEAGDKRGCDVIDVEADSTTAPQPTVEGGRGSGDLAPPVAVAAGGDEIVEFDSPAGPQTAAAATAGGNNDAQTVVAEVQVAPPAAVAAGGDDISPNTAPAPAPGGGSSA